MNTLMKNSISALVLIGLTGPAARLARAQNEGEFEKFSQMEENKRKGVLHKLMSDRAPKLVTVKFVANESFMGRENKSEIEAPGVVVTPDGLVLVNNSKLGGLMGAMRSQFGAMMGQMPEPQVETENFRIIFDNETKEYEAKLIARDSDRDLAWLKISESEGKTFPYIDFNNAAKLEVGDIYYTLGRMAERFDREPLVQFGAVITKVENPRPLLVGNTPGTVVFTDEGELAGYVIAQMPEEGEVRAVSVDVLQSASFFILAAEKIANAREQAEKIAKEKAE